MKLSGYSRRKMFVISLILLLSAGLSSAIDEPGILQIIWTAFTTALLTILKPFIWVLRLFIKFNPQIYCTPDEVLKGCVVTSGVDKLIPYFMDLLVPLYIVAFLFTSAYFIVKSTNPRGRARAKMMLFKLLYSMLIISFAPWIFQLMLDFESMIVEFVFTNGLSDGDYSMMAANMSGAASLATCLLMFIIYKLIYIAVAVSILRYVLVLLFAILFPLFLFLYMFDLTRGWGRKYIKRTITWVFTPVVQAFLLVLTVRSIAGVGSIYNGIPGGTWPLLSYISIIAPITGILLVGAGMILVVLAPLITSKLLGYVGGGLAAWGIATQSAPTMLLGGLLGGGGPGALTSASGLATRTGYYAYSRSLIEGGSGNQPSRGLGVSPAPGSVLGVGGSGYEMAGVKDGESPAARARKKSRKRRSAKDLAEEATGGEAGSSTTRGEDVRDHFQDARGARTAEDKYAETIQRDREGMIPGEQVRETGGGVGAGGVTRPQTPASQTPVTMAARQAGAQARAAMARAEAAKGAPTTPGFGRQTAKTPSPRQSAEGISQAANEVEMKKMQDYLRRWEKEQGAELSKRDRAHIKALLRKRRVNQFNKKLLDLEVQKGVEAAGEETKGAIRRALFFSQKKK